MTRTWAAMLCLLTVGVLAAGPIALGTLPPAAAEAASLDRPAGTAPVLSAGTAPALSAGMAPALSAGMAPALSAGMAPALSAGTAPALSAGTAPALSGYGAADYQLVGVTTVLRWKIGRLDWSPDGAWIAFDFYRHDGYWDVFRIHPDRTGLECLTCNQPQLPNRNQGNPAYDPTGRYLVFQAEKAVHLDAPDYTHPGAGLYNDLWVLDLESDGFYRLTDVSRSVPLGGSLHPHFSHDGSRLLWTDLQGTANCYANWRIAVADFNPTPEPHLENVVYYEPGEQLDWYESQDWSLDDAGIYLSCAPLAGQDDRAQDFCYLDLGGRGPAAGGSAPALTAGRAPVLTRLTETSGLQGELAEWDEHGKISPLGDAIAWATSNGHGIETGDCEHRLWLKADLWIMNLDGSDQTQLTYYNVPGYPEYNPRGVRVTDMSWNPDGTMLAAAVEVGTFPEPKRADLRIFHFAFDP